MEARTSLMCLLWASRARAFLGTVLLTVGDYLSEITATEKGRLHDPALLNVPCRASVYSLGPESRWKRQHTESKRNPSDADSRRCLPVGVAVHGARRLEECPPAGEVTNCKSSFQSTRAPPSARRHPWWPGPPREQVLARPRKCRYQVRKCLPSWLCSLEAQGVVSSSASEGCQS